MEQERTLALALCRVEGIGAVSIRKLLEKTGDVSEIRKLPAESLQKLLGEKKAALLKNWDAPENLERAKRQAEQWKKKGISFDFLWEEAYPKRLKEISDPPLVLYRIGKLPEPEKKMTAIVGARACSSYGKEMAEYFARGLAKEGIGIVSGMARGADGIAQRAALSAGGYSVAVLGCGVEVSGKAVKELNQFDLNNLRWSKVVICTDGDVDGFQIRTLILTMLYRLCPTLIREGYVYIAETPLFEITCKEKSGEKTWFAYSEKEKADILKKLEGKKVNVQRSKGLGENDPEMMWMTTMSPETRRLIRVLPEDAEETARVFDLLLGDNLSGRKDYIAENGYKYLDMIDVS